jgi:hypothetical protein
MEQNQIAKQEQSSSIENFNIESLIQQAVKNKASITALKEILSMREKLKQEWAKEQFNKDMAQFQAECPIIGKTKGVKTKAGIVAYKYAPIEVLDSETKELRNKYGFSYKTDQQTFLDNNERQVRAIVTVTHKFGHSKKTEMTVPLGNKTEIMSNSQVTAAAYTFAKRYAFKNAFGIIEADEDDESLLKQGDVATNKFELDTVSINKINATKTLDELNLVCKGLIKQKGEDYRNEITVQYGLKKTQLEVKK